mgnify:CR=1 FL=1|tara:strand:- start:69 stop:839 length:771 start_codon:yes stop_codon:yes gene_type:complete
MNKNLHKVTSISKWTENLFSFKVQRPPDLKFKSGEFIMIGLYDDNQKPILRAYSICSPNWSNELEFYSIIVENGPLTSKLRNIKKDDDIILMTKSTGTLILDAVKSGERLFLFSTGTGFAPFASLIRDPETYEKFDKIILTHTCRNKNELAYSSQIVKECNNDKLIKEFTEKKLTFYQTTTRDHSDYFGRITDRIMNNLFFQDLNIKKINSKSDRVMICGSIDFNNDLKKILLNLNFEEGATNKPGDFVIEKAFVG